MNFSYLTGEVGKLGIARIKRRIVVGNNALVYDTFTAPDGTLITAHTPDICPIGSVWLHVIGAATPVIQSQKLLFGPAPVPAHTVVIESNKADVTISTDVYYSSNSLTIRAIIARFLNSTNYWLFRHYGLAARIDIYEVNSGVQTLRAFLAYTPPDGLETMVVNLSGNLMTFSIGANSVSYSSAFLNTATKHGMSGLSKTTVPIIDTTFDDFTVTSP